VHFQKANRALFYPPSTSTMKHNLFRDDSAEIRLGEGRATLPQPRKFASERRPTLELVDRLSEPTARKFASERRATLPQPRKLASERWATSTSPSLSAGRVVTEERGSGEGELPQNNLDHLHPAPFPTAQRAYNKTA